MAGKSVSHHHLSLPLKTLHTYVCILEHSEFKPPDCSPMHSYMLGRGYGRLKKMPQPSHSVCVDADLTLTH